MLKLKAAVIALVVAACSLANAQTSAPAPAKNVRFSADMLDKSIDPCTDFYAYACSKWQTQNPIPERSPVVGTVQRTAGSRRVPGARHSAEVLEG